VREREGLAKDRDGEKERKRERDKLREGETRSDKRWKGREGVRKRERET